MANDKQRNWWLLALGLVLLSLVFALGAMRLLAPDDVGRQPPHAKPAAPPVPTPSEVEPPPTSQAAPAVRAPAPEAERPGPVEPAAVQAACARAADCRGPKTADCVTATCEAGRCVFDRSRCECLADAECDDGVECTRDLCFAATKKCIHIRSACN
ncbi:MAG TPA: hypothetical protein VI197_30540 [Polyangiaceae bacterium]